MILSRREIPWLAAILVTGNLFAVGLVSALLAWQKEEQRRDQTAVSSTPERQNPEFLESRLPARLPRAARMKLDEESASAAQPNFSVPLPPPMGAAVAPFKPMPEESPGFAGQSKMDDGWPEDTNATSRIRHESLRPGLNFSQLPQGNQQTGGRSVASMLPSLNPRQPLAAEPHPQESGVPSGSAFSPAAIPREPAQTAAASSGEAPGQPSLSQAKNAEAEQGNQSPPARTEIDASHSASANNPPQQSSLEETQSGEIGAEASPSPSPTPRKRRQRPEPEAKPEPSASPTPRSEPTQPRKRNVPPRKR